MGAIKIDVGSALEAYSELPVIDVRSPAEYEHAHMPGAMNIALFSNDERKIVGTTYKQHSREMAIKTGLDFFGPKMRSIVEQTETLCGSTQSKKLLLHCWRGGMRSEAIAWLLDLYGFEVFTVKGGYKAFRQWVLRYLSQPFPLKVIGGYTGSGKTKLLQHLQSIGEAVIDLEALAGHRGSAFGNLGLPPQHTAEQFENNLAIALFQRMNAAPSCIWIEGESRRIGNVNIPFQFFATMQQAPYYFLKVPFSNRLEEIVASYGAYPGDRLINGVMRIAKRMGGQQAREAIQCIEANKIENAFRLLLAYYDKYYEKSSFDKVNEIIDSTTTDAVSNAALILKLK